MDHILAFPIATPPRVLTREHGEWLNRWLAEVEKEINAGEATSTRCVAGVIAETWLYGRTETDWKGIFESLLTEDDKPLAYSEAFGKKLHDFNFWKQTPVHAAYSRWIAEKELGRDYLQAGRLIEGFVQPDGLVYNPVVSDTAPRARMKAELLMSLAMAAQVFEATSNRTHFDLMTSAAVTIPPTSYVSAEFFRLRALEIMGRPEQMIGDPVAVAERCLVPNGPGFADYNVEDKVDAMMGTKSRTYRDRTVFSPISTLQALYLAEHRPGHESKIEHWKETAKAALEKNPLAIPALKMRDLVDVPFGEGATAFEVMAAAHILDW